MAHLLSIDNGGTFTDICVIGDGVQVHAKTLTTPYDLTKCFFDVLRGASARLYGEADVSRLLRQTDYIRYSTTAGTNAMVERVGPRLGLIVRRGWSADQLRGTDVEGDVFAALVGSRLAEIDTSVDALETSVVEVVNRLGMEGATYLVVSLHGAEGPAEEARVKRAFLRLFPRHLLGAIPVLYSHELVEDLDDRRRTWTALVDAFLHPTMRHFLYNAEKELRKHRTRRPLLVFGNDGSSSRVAKTTAVKTFSSGPRGGLQAASVIAARYGLIRVVTLDVGGTSSDVAFLEGTRVPEKDPGEILGLPVSLRLGDVGSAGIGGSSIFRVIDGKIRVGPRSVGAVPGPACFGRGGTDPTITDAYFLMGVLDSRSYFGGTLNLDAKRATTAITEKVAQPLGLDVDDALLAMEAAYNASIAAVVKEYASIAVDTTLLAFGGAGPMNVCGVADATGIDDIMVPRLAAVFSAFGISFSDISHTYQVLLTTIDSTTVNEKLSALRQRAERDMYAEGFSMAECTVDAWVRDIKGKSIPLAAEVGMAGYPLPLGSGCLELTVTRPIPHYEFPPEEAVVGDGHFEPSATRTVLAARGKRWLKIGVVTLADLKPGTSGEGPLIIEGDYFTCWVGPDWRFQVTPNHDIRMRRKKGGRHECPHH